MRPQDRRTVGDGETAGVYLTRKWIDYLQPLAAMQKSVGTPLNETNDAYLNARLAEDAALSQIQTLHDTYVTPMIDAVRGKAGLEELHRFMYALHAEERNRVVGERNPRDSELHKAVYDTSLVGASGMSTDEANQIIEQFRRDPEKFRALRQGARQMRAMLDVELENQRRTGLISEETYDLLTNQWHNYVPLKGQDGQDEQGNWRPGKSGFDVRGSESRPRSVAFQRPRTSSRTRSSRASTRSCGSTRTRSARRCCASSTSSTPRASRSPRCFGLARTASATSRRRIRSTSA